jgi:hypothetical protein
VIIFCVLFAVYSLRGEGPGWAVKEALTWSLNASIIFLVSGLYYQRRGRSCVLCAGGDNTSRESANGRTAVK